MSRDDRRVTARRRAWGHGPMILRFEPLEERQLLAARAAGPLPDLVNSMLSTPSSLYWGNTFDAVGQVKNQGNAPVTHSFNVELFASSTPTIGPGSVPIGEVTISGGLAAGQSTTYDQSVALPQTPIPGFDATTSPAVYINAWVDPTRTITESNRNNNYDLGAGLDTTAIAITPPQPSQLQGSSFAIATNTAQWGGAVSVTAQVQNNAQGNAPASTARIILTPAGTPPGGPNDVTIGYLPVPAIQAWQNVNLQQTFTLPSSPSPQFQSATAYTISMIQDSTYVTNTIYPHLPSQGIGLDQASITITPGINTVTTTPALPDLAASTVTVPSQLIAWGQTFQAQATVQNLGAADAGPFQVAFILTGAQGLQSSGLWLGETTVAGLKAGTSQTISQMLQLPGILPAGVSLSSTTVGRIAIIIDPDNLITEPIKTNNTALSGPLSIYVPGTNGNGTVPTLPAVTVTPAVSTQASTSVSLRPFAARLAQQRQALRMARDARIAALHEAHPVPLHRIIRKRYSTTQNIVNDFKIFPSKVSKAYHDLLGLKL